MRPWLLQILSVWFVVQLVLPFTAPLQKCDLSDFLGTSHHTLPLVQATEVSESAGGSFVSPIAASLLSASAGLGADGDRFESHQRVESSCLPPSSQVRAVLRL